jgi:hypothetical protein
MPARASSLLWSRLALLLAIRVQSQAVLLMFSATHIRAVREARFGLVNPDCCSASCFNGWDSSRHCGEASKLGTSASHPLNHKQRLRRTGTALAVIGGISLIAAFGDRPTPYPSLIPAAGCVKRVVQVSERESGNSTSSINPFASHDWFELTVSPTAPSGLHEEDVVWRVNVLENPETFAQLKGENIDAKVDSLSGHAKAYELKANDSSLVQYEDVAAFERRGATLFLIAGTAFLIGGATFLLRSNRVSSSAP